MKIESKNKIIKVPIEIEVCGIYCGDDCSQLKQDIGCINCIGYDNVELELHANEEDIFRCTDCLNAENEMRKLIKNNSKDITT
jgi:hypothetical protein